MLRRGLLGFKNDECRILLDDVYANDTPLTYKICILFREDGYVRENNHTNQYWQ